MNAEMQLLSLSILLLLIVVLLYMENYTRRATTSFKKEKRVHPRHKASLRIKYKTPFEEGISWIKDISESGARLILNKTLKTLEIGQSLGIEINLPDYAQPIVIQGNIVWSKEDDAGFNFDRIEQGEIKSVIQYIGEENQHTPPKEVN